MSLLSTRAAASARGFGLLGKIKDIADPYFNYVTALLHGDGTNGGQNNTFLDSSANNFTITRNGNTTQGSFSPYGDNWSNYFDASGGDYLTVSANSFSTSGSWTIEAWCYFTDGSRNDVLINGLLNDRLYVQYIGTSLYVGDAVTNNLVISNAKPINQWFHLAVVKNGSTYTAYINGVSVGSSTTALISATISTWQIGARTSQSAFSLGYISSLRITTSAVYTGNFTPSTSPLTAISGTSLLTCQSNRFIDNSSNNFAITLNGDISVQRFSPFAPRFKYIPAIAGGSGYFDGAGDYLVPTSSAIVDFGTGDFTVEMFVYAATPAVSYVFFDGRSAGGQNAITLAIDSSKQIIFFNNNGTARITAAGFVPNTWNHIAVTRSGTSVRLFSNGTQIGSTYTDSSSYVSGTNRPTIGAAGFAEGGSPLTGYMASVRIVKGTAVYTANFTPPTAPLTAITNTSLLCNFTNAAIFDNAMMNDLQTVGNAQISTSVKKYGTGSLAFDGTGDWLTCIDNPNLLLVSGNFTIEGWVYLSATGVAYGIVSKGTSTTGWSVNVTSGNKLQFSYTSSNLTGATSLAATTWYYFAVVRNGSAAGNLKIYINGTADATSAGAVTDNFNQTSIMYVGANRVGGSALNGYIDDLRITKGIARYTADFTPPAQAFPNQ
jgi:hypothetical protein